MKMFNKVYAPFSGTITESLIDGEGVIIKKGQSLFKVSPDHQVVEVDPAQVRAEARAYSAQLCEEVLARYS